MSITVVGSIAFDDVVTQHKSVSNSLGGSALYFATAASIYAPVNMVGVVGDDFPMDDLSFLSERSVDLSGINIIEGGRTFRWGGEYELDMNKRKTTNLELNVFQDFDPKLSEKARTAPCVFLGNIEPSLQLKVFEQAEDPAFVAADTIECYLENSADLFRRVLSCIDLLFINDSEAQLFTGENNVISAAKALLADGPEYVIIKKGEHGSILVSNDSFFTVPAYPVEKVLDPTGAGDSYAGAVLGYLAREGRYDEATMRKAVVHGSIVGAALVEGFSLDTLKALTLESIDERFDCFKDMTRF